MLGTTGYGATAMIWAASGTFSVVKQPTALRATMNVTVGLQPLIADIKSGSRTPEKCSKSHLLEVVVVGEGDVESFGVHDRIGRAVG